MARPAVPPEIEEIRDARWWREHTRQITNPADAERFVEAVRARKREIERHDILDGIRMRGPVSNGSPRGGKPVEEGGGAFGTRAGEEVA